MSYKLKKYFSMIPYLRFCKILSRLEEEGVLKQKSKGIYIINFDDLSENRIIGFYANDYAGVVVGYHILIQLD